MASQLILLIAALVAQECSAVPVVLPTSLIPSFTLTGIPIPTGARLDIPKREEDLPPFFPSLSLSLPFPVPTGDARQPAKRDDELPALSFTLPTELPSLTATPIVTVTPILSLSLPPLPTGDARQAKRDEELPAFSLTLPTDLPSLSIALPPLPTGSLAAEEKRQYFSSDIPESIATLSEPTGSSLLPKRDAPTLTASLPTPTGLPTGLPTGPVPTGLPTGLPEPPLVPGGLMSPGRH